MKKFFVFLFVLNLFLVSTHQTVSAQEDKDFRFSVKANPLAALAGPFYFIVLPVTGEYRVVFEAKTFEKQSFQLGLSYIGPSVILNTSKIAFEEINIKTSGYRAQGLYKLFLTAGGPLEGLYIGPHISYSSARLTNEEVTDDHISLMKLTISGVLGYQLITKGGFALDIFTGFGYKNREYVFAGETWDMEEEWPFSGGRINIPIGFSFGLAF